MDSNVLSLLQGLSSPADLAGGMCSYFKNHTTRIKNILTNVVNMMPSDPDSTGSDFDLGEGVIIISNESSVIKNVHLENLTTSLRQVINDNDNVSLVPIEVRDYSAGRTDIEYYTYEQVIDLLREQSDIADSLITTLTSYQDWLTDDSLNFEQLSLDRVNNLLPATSVVADKLKQGISSIATRYSNSIRDYAPSVLQNIMGLFGVGVSTYSDQQVSTFTGVNAWTVVLGDVIDGINTMVTQAPNMVARLFGTIGFAIGKLVSYAAEKLYSAVEKTILNVVGATDAFKACALLGDKTVSCCDWKYTADSTYYSTGTETFKDFIDKVHDYWSDRDVHELSIPLFAGVLNFQETSANTTSFNLLVKPLNCTAINVAWTKTMGGSHLFYKLIQPSTGVIKRNPNSDDYPGNLTRDDLRQFFTELAKNPDLYYLKTWKTDADAFMACQCGKIVSFLQLLLMLDTIPEQSTFVSMLLNCSYLADFRIEDEPNYSAQYSTIEPSNVNMMHYLTSLSLYTYAFNTGSGNVNEYTPNTYVTIANLDVVWSFLASVIDTLSNLDVLSAQGLSCFLPYQTLITYRRSSFYIPSDSNNIDLVKGILKTGLTVAAIAAVVLVGLSVRSALKKKAFELDAKAGALSWKAAENGDVAKIKKCYKLSKRANILSKIAGYTQAGTAQAINSLINNNANNEVVPIELQEVTNTIKVLIAGR